MQSVETHLFDKIVLSLMEYVQKYHRNHSDEINYFGENELNSKLNHRNAQNTINVQPRDLVTCIGKWRLFRRLLHNPEELAYMGRMLLIKNFVVTAGEHVIPGTVLFRQWKHKVKFHPGENVSWLKDFCITFAHLNCVR